MTGHYLLKEDKTYEPCDLMTWCKQFENMQRHVAYDIINGYKVSTVWLGLDHSYFGDKPLLFETMIFHKDTGTDIYCERYSTWPEAEEGHAEAIKWVLDGGREDDENELD